MKQYLDLCHHVLNHGVKKMDRTGTGTLSIFGYQMRFNLQEGFPLLTTKKMYTRAIIHELLWFLKGDTNLEYLVQNRVKIWNEWGYEGFKKSPDFHGESMEDYVNQIKNDHSFAEKHGDLGPIYGKQWRDFNGVDQVAKVVESLKTNPNSRRHIISAWNPNEVDQMALPPCHVLMQFYVVNHRLSCQLYQRSADIFLGVPFNIASYALLTHLMADVVGLEVGEFIHTLGDAHIYLNHLDQVKEQITRSPFPLPQLVLHQHHHCLEDYQFDDIEVVNYQSHPKLVGAISV